MEVVISLGSNLGDRLANLQKARGKIAQIEGVRLLTWSRVYETEPVGVAPEDAGKLFLNAIVVVDSESNLDTLVGHLARIETALGRVRGKNKNAPRTLDADIICAGDISIRTDDLTVPHPRWAERRFVVEPLAEVRPDLLIPGETRTVRQVLATLPQKPAVWVFRDEW